MIKRLYIITFHRSCSHGALLQCLASQEFFRSLGIDTFVLDYRNKAIEEEYKLIKRVSFSNGIKFFVKNMAFQIINLPFYYCKKRGFRKFRKNYLFLSKKIESLSQMDSISDADAFMAGSDQIWNSEITGILDDVYFLNFPSNALKMSLAASIGKELVDCDEINRINDLVSKIDCITVREEKTRALLINHKKRIDVICDPVFFVKKDYWISLIKNRKYVGKKYILIYALSYDSDISIIAKEISEKYNLAAISIARNFSSSDGIGKRVFAYSPIDLVYYISNSELILTNSFHGLAISIIMQKNFYAFCPIKRSVRIIELLNNCGLSNRLYGKSVTIDNVINNINIDYSCIEEKINAFSEYGRKIVVDYLNNVRVKNE